MRARACAHGEDDPSLGEERSNYFNAVSPPVIQSSNFAFQRLDDFRKAIGNELKNTVYTRGNNPTVEILRKKLAALEKTEDALVFASGSQQRHGRL